MTINEALAQAREINLPDIPEAPKPKVPMAGAACWNSVAGNFVSDLYGKTEASPMSLLLTFLSVLGSGVTEPYAMHEATRHPLTIWSAIIGLSSKSRKGQSLDLTQECFKQSLEGQFSMPIPQSGVTSGEGLIHAIRDPLEDADGNLLLNRKGDPVDAGVTDKRLLLFIREFSTLLHVMGRAGNTTSGLARDAWDGKRLQNLNKNTPEKSTNPHVTIVGHTTPEELRQLLKPLEMANGLGNRFLWVIADRQGFIPSPPIYKPSEGLKSDLKAVIQYARKPDAVTRSPEAEEYWVSIYEELSEESSGYVGSMHARDEAYAMRLSCLFALMRRSYSVEVKDIQAALDILAYNKASLMYQFESTDYDPDILKIITAIDASENRELTRTKIHKVLSSHKSGAHIDSLKSKLLEMKAIAIRMETTSGRDVEIWSRLWL
jgi:hypothetical protein